MVGSSPRSGVPAGQAGQVHVQRSISVVPPRPGRRRRRRGGRGVELVERVAQRLVAEHRALEAGGADLDAEQVEQVVGPEGLDLGERLALDLVGQEARARLADRAAAAGEPDPLDDAVADADLERDPVAAQRVAALEARARILDDPEVVGPPGVLEDVVAVQVVHGYPSVARTSNPDQRGRICRVAPWHLHVPWCRGSSAGPSARTEGQMPAWGTSSARIARLTVKCAPHEH